MTLYVHRVNTINEAYKCFYKHNLNRIELDVQLTQDNKVVVYHDFIGKLRLKKFRNIFPDYVTLEEFLRHTPAGLEINVELKRYDDRDYSYRVIRICENFKKKHKYIYSSFDPFICKQIQCMKRPVMLLCNNVNAINPYYNKHCIHKDILTLVQPEFHESAFVYGVESMKEYETLKCHYPNIQGWIVDAVPRVCDLPPGLNISSTHMNNTPQ